MLLHNTCIFAFEKVYKKFMHAVWPLLALLILSLSCTRLSNEQLVPLEVEDVPSFAMLESGIRSGVLSNGINYYILANTIPAQRVRMHLVVHAGSIHERDDQLGLAHFTEHLMFQGLHGLPMSEVSRLRSRPDAHIGAFVTYTHTCYHIDLSVSSSARLNAAVGILQAWSLGPRRSALAAL